MILCLIGCKAHKWRIMAIEIIVEEDE